MGKTITPTHLGAILALRYNCNSKKPLSIRQIAEQLQVSKSAVQSISQYVVKNAQANHLASTTSNASISTPMLSRTLTTAVLVHNIEAATAFLNVINGELKELLEETEEQQRILIEADSEARRAEESVYVRLVEEEVEEGEEDIMERLREISEDNWLEKLVYLSYKDYLVGIVKWDWNTHHMNLIDLQRTAGFGHVYSSTILKALHEHGI
ncbi:hypothetical protein HOY82DRAFT_635811 [Tuber indicum]|nr:hypothetical protein HOY82DRAFT_635811 [Tuber indicum]